MTLRSTGTFVRRNGNVDDTRASEQEGVLPDNQPDLGTPPEVIQVSVQGRYGTVRCPLLFCWLSKQEALSAEGHCSPSGTLLSVGVVQ